MRSPGYAAGNILNLLCLLNVDLADYNFSHLTVWQAYLSARSLQRVNFAHSDLAKCVFNEDLSITLSLAFSPDGLLATGDADGEIRVWQVSDGKKLFTCKGHTNWIWSVAFSPIPPNPPDEGGLGGILASGSEDKTVKLWNWRTGKCCQTLTGHTDWIRCVTFSWDGQSLASGSNDHTVRLWDVSTGKCYQTLTGHTNWVWSVAFSWDGQYLASASDDHTVKLWDLSTGRCSNLNGHTNWVRSLAFSPDGQILASGSDDHTVKLWNINTGECWKTFYQHTNWVRSVAFSGDGQTLASGSGDHSVKLWDIGTGECCKTLQGDTSRVWSVAFSPIPPNPPDQGGLGGILASGSDDFKVRLWDVRTGECRQLQGHTAQVRSVAFCAKGKILASTSGDNTVKLWDVETGECRQTLHKHTHWVRSLAFDPTGKLLAVGSEDNTVKSCLGGCF